MTDDRQRYLSFRHILMTQNNPLFIRKLSVYTNYYYRLRRTLKPTDYFFQFSTKNSFYFRPNTNVSFFI